MRARSRLLVLTCSLLAVTAIASCGKDSAEAKNCRNATGGKLTLVARNVAWNASCIDAKPGTIRFTVDNKESVQHNLRVTGNGVNEHTKLQSGPVIQHLAVPVKAGAYSFVCDIHANMEGTLYVK